MSARLLRDEETNKKIKYFLYFPVLREGTVVKMLHAPHRVGSRCFQCMRKRHGGRERFAETEAERIDTELALAICQHNIAVVIRILMHSVFENKARINEDICSEALVQVHNRIKTLNDSSQLPFYPPEIVQSYEALFVQKEEKKEGITVRATPLVLACFFRADSIVQLLIDSGAKYTNIRREHMNNDLDPLGLVHYQMSLKRGRQDSSLLEKLLVQEPCPTISVTPRMYEDPISYLIRSGRNGVYSEEAADYIMKTIVPKNIYNGDETQCQITRGEGGSQTTFNIKCFSASEHAIKDLIDDRGKKIDELIWLAAQGNDGKGWVYSIGHHILYYAILFNKEDIIQAILRTGTNINILAILVDDSRLRFAQPPLILSCFNDRVGTAEMLINTGKCDVNIEYCYRPPAEDLQKTTPLLQAIRYRSMKVFDLLIENKADVNYRPKFYKSDGKVSHYGRTPLAQAIMGGVGYAVEKLLDNGANVSLACGKEVVHPIHYIASYGTDSIFSKYIDTCKSQSQSIPSIVNTFNIHFGMTPLEMAYNRLKYSVAKSLITHGADIYAPISKESDDSIIYYATTNIEENDSAALDFYKHALLNEPFRDRDTGILILGESFRYAISARKFKLAGALLAKRFNKESPIEGDITPFAYLCRLISTAPSNRFERNLEALQVIKGLLECQVDVNKIYGGDDIRASPIHYVCAWPLSLLESEVGQEVVSKIIEETNLEVMKNCVELPVYIDPNDDVQFKGNPFMILCRRGAPTHLLEQIIGKCGAKIVVSEYNRKFPIIHAALAFDYPGVKADVALNNILLLIKNGASVHEHNPFGPATSLIESPHLEAILEVAPTKSDAAIAVQRLVDIGLDLDVAVRSVPYINYTPDVLKGLYEGRMNKLMERKRKREEGSTDPHHMVLRRRTTSPHNNT
jgi:ankyrin repeat protein